MIGKDMKYSSILNLDNQNVWKINTLASNYIVTGQSSIPFTFISFFHQKIITFNVKYKPMSQPEALFESISQKLSSKFPEVSIGKMMSSPGLKFQDKVFAFYHNNSMGFRLGPTFEPNNFGLKEAKPLSPFKTKPPLKGWFVIDFYEHDSWELLAEKALDFTTTLK